MSSIMDSYQRSRICDLAGAVNVTASSAAGEVVHLTVPFDNSWHPTR